MDQLDEPRLPGDAAERPERPARLIGLAAVVVGLGLCTGVAALGLQGGAVAAQSPTSAPAGAATTAAALPAAGADTATTPPRLSATGPLALIADDIRLPQEDDPGWSGTNWDVSLCSEPRPRYDWLTTANDLRVIHTLAANPRRLQLMAVGRDETAAANLVRDLSQPFVSCRVRGAEAARTADAAIEGDQWQEGRILALSVEDQDVNAYLVVARAGRAVVAQARYGSSLPATDGSTVDEATVKELQGFLDTMAERVCRYREGGCYTPPPPVHLPPPGSMQLPDGTWQLPDGSVVDQAGSLMAPAPTVPMEPPPGQQQPLDPALPQQAQPEQPPPAPEPAPAPEPVPAP